MSDCCTHITPGLQVNIQKYDPSGTLSLQNTFARELRRRFLNVEKAIIAAVVTQDCFGLKEKKLVVHAKNNTTIPDKNQFDFPRSADKVAEFNKWLQRQLEREILEVTDMRRVGSGVEASWTNKYITDSYKRGLIRSQYDLKKVGLSIPSGTQAIGVDALMSTPLHVDRLGLLFTRTFSDLKGITAAMDTQISRVLAQGIADGDNPRLLARKLLSTINGTGMGDLGITDTLGRFIPARTRAELLARTEIVRAHHQAMIQEYRNWGVLGVTVNVEWVAGKDNRVCEKCQELDGKIFTLDEIENKIPAHPRCRCSIVAKFVKEDKKKVKTKS